MPGLQKGYVGFYMMCIYMNEKTKKNGLRHDIQNALAISSDFYKEHGWA